MRCKLCPKCQRLMDYNLKYCLRCEPKVAEEKKELHKIYNRNRTDKDIVALYKTQQWDKVRNIVRTRLKGLAIYSYYIFNKLEYADLYHHIVEVKDDESRVYDIENVIGLTNSNHNKIHGLYDKSENSKEKTQEILFNLLDRWNREMRGSMDNLK